MLKAQRSKICAILMCCVITLANADECPQIEIVPRSEWGARISEPYTAIVKPVLHVIIGHTVTPECYNKDECAARMRGMQNFHMDSHGWPDIGYNFVVGGDGRVYEGVGWNTEGIHTLGWNAKSYGIAFIGNYMNAKPKSNMLKAARSLIVCGIKKSYISLLREIHGARDATCTLSPGNLLYEAIKEWPRFKEGPLPGYRCSMPSEHSENKIE